MTTSRVVPLTVACALFMENLDTTIMATALPAIGRSLNEDPLHLSLAISAYLFSLSLFIPVSGWFADRFGASRVFRHAITLFLLGSIACAASHTLAQLVAARVLQGLGGAMMVPVGRLVMVRQIPKHELVSAMSWLAAPALIAPIIGPPLGGLITTLASWRWIFLINLPIGLLGYWMAVRYIRDLDVPHPLPFDLSGWLLLGGGIVGLMFGFENLGKRLLPGELTAASLLIGMVATGLYLRHAQRSTHPVLRLDLFRLSTFRASTWGGALFRIGIGAYLLLLPMMLQLGFGMTALESGSITFAGAVGAVAMKAVAQPISRRYGFRRLLLWNTWICAGSLFTYALLEPETPVWLIIVLLLAGGFFRSLQFTCANALAFAEIENPEMSQATSLSSTVQQLALSLGVGIGSQVLNLSLALRQTTQPDIADFHFGLAVAGLITLAAWPSFARLAPQAGAQMSGHR